MTKPFAWAAILRFFRQRELPGVEQITESSYRRGEVSVTFDEAASALRVLGPDSPIVRKRLTDMFDVNADRAAISLHLDLAPAFLPGAWCPFELAVRAILGQQISVAAARTLAGRLIARTEISPAPLATAQLDGLGILPSRVRTLQSLSRAAREPSFDYSRNCLLRIPGIGPWTAEYIAMRAGREADAFPAGDLILRRTAIPGQTLTERALLEFAERWRPYRAYAALALWNRASTFR